MWVFLEFDYQNATGSVSMPSWLHIVVMKLTIQRRWMKDQMRDIVELNKSGDFPNMELTIRPRHCGSFTSHVETRNKGPFLKVYLTHHHQLLKHTRKRFEWIYYLTQSQGSSSDCIALFWLWGMIIFKIAVTLLILLILVTATVTAFH